MQRTRKPARTIKTRSQSSAFLPRYRRRAKYIPRILHAQHPSSQERAPFSSLQNETCDEGERDTPVLSAQERVERAARETIRAAHSLSRAQIQHILPRINGTRRAQGPDEFVLRRTAPPSFSPAFPSSGAQKPSFSGRQATKQAAQLARRARRARAAQAQSRRAIQGTVRVARTTARAAVATVRALAHAVWTIGSVIVAGGWVSVVVVVAAAIVALLLFSPVGIVYANETVENQPMTQAIAAIHSAFYEEIQSQVDYITTVSRADSFRIVYTGDLDGDSLAVNNWIDVLGVYAVLVTQGDSAADAATVTPEKAALLQEVFHKMNQVSYRTETSTTHTEVETEDGVQNVEHTELTLFLSVESLDYRAGAEIFWFDEAEMEMLELLMGPEFVPLLAALLGTDPFDGAHLEEILGALPPNERGTAIVQAALSKIGCKYVFGARGPTQFDCSGFVYFCLNAANSPYANDLRTTAAGQAQTCTERGWLVAQASLQPGDLVFWQNAACGKGDRWNEVHHTGIYAGNGKVIEASSSRGCVVLRDLWSSSTYPLFCCARVPSGTAEGTPTNGISYA